MEMNRQQKLQRLQDLQRALELCTKPVDGHTDPGSINDCWNSMRELISEIKDEDEKLLLRAQQYQKEQEFRVPGYENEAHVLRGIKLIVRLIKRHLGVEKQ